MLLKLVRRYWLATAGTMCVLVVIVAATIVLGQNAVSRLAEVSAREKAQLFATYLKGSPTSLDALLTGLTRDPDSEAEVTRLASMAGIANFTVFDPAGNEAFSLHSDRHAWLMRERPGGTVAGDRLNAELLADTGSWTKFEAPRAGTVNVVVPLDRDARRVGYLSVSSDVAALVGDFVLIVRKSIGGLLLVIGAFIGIPVFMVLQRKRRIEQANERIDFLANYDPLTHLLNRRRMQQETDRILATSRATREAMAFWLLDLEGMAEINSANGQEAGDEVLRTVASRLLGVVERHDLISRIGADDFVLLQRHIVGSSSIEALAKRIVEAVHVPVEIGSRTFHPRLRMGLALVPDHGRTFTHLVRHAELALTVDKSSNSGDYTIFDVSLDEEAHRRREIEKRIRKALESDGFELFYQPIVSGSDRTPLGFEALIRLPDGQGQYISPAAFIPIAEARGYIKPIGNWVIQEAIRQIALWPDHLTISVNLSAVQFRDGDLVEIIEDALRTSGVDGRRLEIEIVESLLLERSDLILDQLKALKAIGVSIAMDDFGTGYSSLGYLWRFPFDKVKIDQSFMVAFEQGEPNVPQILETIISLAHHMQMRVTTEGVETKAQMELLSDLRCDALQGYYFGRPAPADRVASELLQSLPKKHPSSSDSGRPELLYG